MTASPDVATTQSEQCCPDTEPGTVLCCCVLATRWCPDGGLCDWLQLLGGADQSRHHGIDASKRDQQATAGSRPTPAGLNVAGRGDRSVSTEVLFEFVPVDVPVDVCGDVVEPVGKPRDLADCVGLSGCLG